MNGAALAIDPVRYVHILGPNREYVNRLLKTLGMTVLQSVTFPREVPKGHTAGTPGE